MIVSHFWRSTAKLVEVVAMTLRPTGLAEHHVARARRAAPPLLRGAEQDVDAELGHVHPERPRRDAVEDEEPTDRVRRRGDGADVVVGQQHARRRLHVCREDDLGTVALDGLDHLVDRRRGPGSVPLVGHRAGAADGRLAGHGPGVEDLRPAVGEQTVADDEAAPPGRQLPGDRFHGVGAATRDDRDRLGAVGRAQDVDDVLHHPDEALATCGSATGR